MRSKDAKKITQEFSEKIGISINQFFENKIHIESCQIEASTLFLFNGKPLLAKSDNILFFTLFFDEIFSLFPKVVVDMGAVPYVCKGADVMAPGIQEIHGEFNENGLVLVVDERHRKPLAVGLALFSSEEMKKIDRGKTIKTLHYVGDKLWNGLKGS
ncbi:MAG: RNA-binding protein [Candidatus Bathyarchaeota archaeon]|nr:MAG: RNA-binding protein [Candidatus Bathyarchaeota archaeon]